MDIYINVISFSWLACKPSQINTNMCSFPAFFWILMTFAPVIVRATWTNKWLENPCQKGVDYLFLLYYFVAVEINQ